MIKPHPKKQKSKAQAMLEFALVLPVLLVIIYGLIEVGRVLFIYSSVVTSARSAARYGATIGLNQTGGVPRYTDCAGMRAAARSTAFIDSYADADIVIMHDEGGESGTPPTEYCMGGAAVDNGWAPNNGNDERVVVTVTSQFVPIVPLVPLGTINISSTSGRTVLVSVAISITQAPQTWTGATSTSGPSPTSPPSDTPAPTATCALPGSTTLSGSVGAGNHSDLTWTTSAGATSYDLYIALDGVTFSLNGNYAGTSANNVDTVSAGSAHYYLLVPKTACGSGPNSNTLLLTNGAVNTSTYTPTPSRTPSPTITPTPSKTSTPTGTPTRTATAFACDVRHSALKTSPTYSMTIFNYSSVVTINISQIQIYWHTSNPGGQQLTSLTLGGLQIWSGTDIGSPSVMTVFTGTVSIAPGASKPLAVGFKKPYFVDGAERVTVNFLENGCLTLDSSNSGQLP